MNTCDPTRIIEGQLKKRKGEGSFRLFSQFTKRWFTIDLARGVWYYSQAKGKKAKKLIHMNDTYRC